MIICQNCGSEVNDDAKFCKNCGAKIIKEEESKKTDEIIFCANCGCKIVNNAKFCPDCGNPTNGVAEPIIDNVVHANKSPVLAAILSFLIIGVGQIYVGLTKKGILLFVGAIISGFLMLIYVGWILWFIIWIYGIYDAYNSANKLNNGEVIEDGINFNNLF